ncbi:EamA family transporter [Aneurinibacillus sp. BA2021]|nr:EamA family transporter [Aneurinibacillus sp. BA2021]
MMQETNPVFPMTWTYIAPVIALFAGGLFLRETILLIQLAGGAAVLLGVLLLNMDTWKKMLHKKEAKGGIYSVN